MTSQKAPYVKLSGESLMEWFSTRGGEWGFHAVLANFNILAAGMALRRGDDYIYAAAYGAACGHVFRCHELFYDRRTA